MDAGFFTIATKHVGFANNPPILYDTHDQQILFMLIPGVKKQGPYTTEVSCPISLPHPPLLPSRETARITVLTKASNPGV